MTEKQTPYETTVTPLPDEASDERMIPGVAVPVTGIVPGTEPGYQAPSVGSLNSVCGFEPALVLLDVPAWPIGGEIKKLLLVVVRDNVPDRNGIVVDATVVYREAVVSNFGELREALGCTRSSSEVRHER